MKQAYWIRRTHLLRADEYICSAWEPCAGMTIDLYEIEEVLSRLQAEGLSALLDDDF